MATAAQVAEHRAAETALTELARRDLAEFFTSLNLNADPAALRDALLEFMPVLVQTYGDTAAVLGADYYDMLRDVPPSAASFRAVLAEPPSLAQVEGSTRALVGPLWDEVPDHVGVLEAISGALDRLVLQPGRDTVMESAWADTVRTGVARVPRGINTCSFCKMLASRGPVYRSEISANMVVGRGSLRTGYDANGERLRGGIGQGIKARGVRDIGQTFHDNCHCTTVIIRSPADFPAGYDPDDYYRAWKAESRRSGVSHSAS